MKNSGKIAVALIAGAAAGAILGLLFAPSKGSDTRDKLKKKGKKFRDDMKEKFKEGKEKVKEFGEEIQQIVKKAEEANQAN